MRTAPSARRGPADESVSLPSSLQLLSSEAMLVWSRSALLLSLVPSTALETPRPGPPSAAQAEEPGKEQVLFPLALVAAQLLLVRHGLDLKQQPGKFESTGAGGGERGRWTFKEPLPVGSQKAGPGNRHFLPAVSTPTRPAPAWPHAGAGLMLREKGPCVSSQLRVLVLEAMLMASVTPWKSTNITNPRSPSRLPNPSVSAQEWLPGYETPTLLRCGCFQNSE